METLNDREVIEESCRVCMTKYVVLKNIFGSKTRNIAEEIYYCTGLLILQTDTLPTKICIKCLKNLTTAHKFKKLCLATDTFLKKLQNEIQTVTQYDVPVIGMKEELVDVWNDDERIGNDEKDDKVFVGDGLGDDRKFESNVQVFIEELPLEEKVDSDVDDKTKIEKLEGYDNKKSDDEDGEQKCDEKKGGRRIDKKKLLNRKNKETRKKCGRFVCNRCNINFNHYTSFIKHNVKVHNEQESYVCEICGHNTKTYYAYRRHLKIHKAPKYNCDHCNYKGYYKTNLVKHIATHSAERRFQCDQCPDSFRAYHGLYNHVRVVHKNKEKKAKCPQCDKVYSDNSKLRRHMDSHFNIKRHECEVCFVKYTDRFNLKKHMLTEHDISLPRLERQWTSKAVEREKTS